jgi:hypothetical protein
LEKAHSYQLQPFVKLKVRDNVQYSFSISNLKASVGKPDPED